MARPTNKADQLSPDRPLLCHACKVKFPASSYGKTASGLRRIKCQACSLPYEFKKCIRCKKSVPRKGNFVPRASGRLRDVCNACTKPPKTSAVCKKCNKDQPFEMYKFHGIRGKRDERCKECRRQKKEDRWCGGCQAFVPDAEFARYRSKSGSIFLARQCPPCTEKRLKHASHLMVAAPHPCMQCGKQYQLAVAQNRRERRKFCSPECVKAAATTLHECTLCLRELSRDAFDEKSGGRGIVNSCRECRARRAEGLAILREHQISARTLLASVRRKASQRGLACTLTKSWADAQASLPCALCGAHMACLALKDGSQDATPANVVPVCGDCQHMLKFRRYEVLLHWARSVAKAHPVHEKAAEVPARPRKHPVRESDRQPAPPKLSTREAFEAALKEASLRRGYQGSGLVLPKAKDD